MNFSSRFKFSAVAGILTILVCISCEKDPTTIGASVIGGEPFATGQQSFDVFAYNKKIEAVRTNRLPMYQLGVFNDPIYGKTEARITSQLLLATPNPTFGTYSQAVEDVAESDESVTTVQENETVTSVYLHIPYLTSDVSQRDSDNDGVDDVLEKKPEDVNDPNSDWDGDTVTDIQEKTAGTDPFNVDTDGDGENDAEDLDTIKNRFPKRFDLDSIYGVDLSDEEAMKINPFKVKVERSTYFLRDLDPTTNFEEAQEYFSNQSFSPSFASDVLNEGDGEVIVSNEEIVTYKDDDPDTEVDEKGEVKDRFAPGIYIPLDPEYFEENIIDKEGSSELLSQANFSDYFRGVHLSLEASSDIMVLFDLTQATIMIDYTYDSVNSEGEAPSNPKEGRFTLSLLRVQNGAYMGNAVNTFVNDDIPSEISDKMDTHENASQIYLKGGPGSYAEIKLFGENDVQAQEVIDQIKSNNWVINEANLVFYVDRSSLPEGAIEPLRLYLYNADTNEFLFDTTTDPAGETPLSSYLQYDGLLEKESGKGIKYKVRITKYINDIILRDAENATLGLALTPNINLIGTATAMLADPEDNEKEIPVASTLTPLSTVLWGSEVAPIDQDKKLKLEISYTKAN
ncbi:DUF4270 family protein [Maribacter algicola]|uniref:DUF4270 family protein n=1 Tax=Meishania litoralis TaxID=3434685 RepID=A0ACC7LJA5_9FLAO